MDALTLMQVQARTLYQIDPAGDLHLIPDLTAPASEWEAAPRFFMGRTAQGNVWHFRHDLSAELKSKLDALCRSEPPFQEGQEPGIAPQVREVLGGGADWHGPAYLLPPQAETGRGVEITAQNVTVLLPDFPGTAERARTGRGRPITAIIENGQAVAVCSSVRQSELAAEAGVFTLESSRGKGHAAQVTAVWANLVYQQGLLPLYSTSWVNTASQTVARKLNSQFFGEDWSVQ